MSLSQMRLIIRVGSHTNTHQEPQAAGEGGRPQKGESPRRPEEPPLIRKRSKSAKATKRVGQQPHQNIQPRTSEPTGTHIPGRGRSVQWGAKPCPTVAKAQQAPDPGPAMHHRSFTLTHLVIIHREKYRHIHTLTAKFKDDATIVGLITNYFETTYRKEDQYLVKWHF